ncbi:nuclear transport factor 2 family protein [Telmatospirillum siberiense]|uniref:Nuclear transport factor 2 family protein n=2 Tax=Telmatospirillum siberiense TaxID=382514 RepID=A0A2N3PQX1_9PROT|nr:nuclear transport factor 2 family protein [Telmatospirillum siberiense]
MGGAAQAAETSADTAAVAKIVEVLRAAMVAGDGKVLKAVLHDRLTYSHSDGHLQTKAMVLDELAGKNSFASLALSDQTIDVVGNVAVVRHIFDSVNNLPEGKTSSAHIKVLQVWVKAGKGWKLLARASTPIKA